MHNAVLLNMIQHFGYLALFFALWLGIVGMPIPDEVIVMTAGLVTALGLLNPILAFLLTYLGVVSGLSVGYLLGNQLGAPVIDRLVRKKKTGKYLRQAQAMLNKFGHYALPISYFLPMVRHLVPYLVGISKMPYRNYVAYAYSTGFVWTLIYFIVGRIFGNHIDQIAQMVTRYGFFALAILCVSGFIVWRGVCNGTTDNTSY
ncbi:DedA family protein [Desulfosporosinus sp. SYSU MS00001]|uniref:DedA family protein n=1 Tax=Desulfosporosinus sp. SYSU MS00001 TaxID=3416284 RepID=UPI003CEB0D96